MQLLDTSLWPSAPAFRRSLGDPRAPILAVALHQGHDLRAEVAAAMGLDADTRLREEDPYSGVWTHLSPNRLIALRSRFEVDLNRPPDGAVYLGPAEAWGLSPWRVAPSPALVARSLEVHAHFYDAARHMIERLLERSPRVLVLDLHTYNHRRQGPDGPIADPIENPSLNLGTGSVDRARWAPVVDGFLRGARRARIDGQAPDVRENVRFRGGYFSTWVNETFPGRACALAIEVKKTFMDEWTGALDPARLAAWRDVIAAGTAEALAALGEVV